MLHVHVMSCKFLMALKNMVAFSIAWEKCAEPLSCNFQQEVFVVQGGKKARRLVKIKRLFLFLNL